LVVVFDQQRGIEPDPDAALRDRRICRTMTRAGCQCEDLGNGKRLPRPAGVIIGSARIDLAGPRIAARWKGADRSRYAELLRIDCSIRLTALPSIDGVRDKTLK
jgi:hypothetical protein